MPTPTRRTSPLRITGGLLLLAMAAWVLLAPVGAAAQDFGDGGPPPAPNDLVTWTLEAQPDPVRPGEVLTLTATAVIQPPWHIYAIVEEPAEGEYWTPTTFVPSLPEGWTLEMQDGEPWVPDHAAHEFVDTWDQRAMVYEGTVRVRAQVRVPTDATPGDHDITVGFDFLVCDDSQCLMKEPAEASVTVAVAAGDVRAEHAAAAWWGADTDSGRDGGDGEGPGDAAGSDAGTGVAQKALEKGAVVFLLGAFLAGIASLFTPCVFPMIPITVSFFTKHAGAGRAKGVGLASAYAGAIIGTFTVLGLGMTLVMGTNTITQFAANPWVNLFTAALLVVLALNLFGLFEIKVPQFLMPKTRPGVAGAADVGMVMVMGFSFTLASFTCTVAFVGGLLTMAATLENPLMPVLGMLVYSVTFAAPFFLLALFPRYIEKLPKGGGLNSVKVVLGFIELAAAFKFMSNADLVFFGREDSVLTFHLNVAIWAAIAFTAGMYLLGRFRLPHDTPPEDDAARISVPRMTAAMAFLATGLLLVGSMMGGDLPQWMLSLLPPRPVQATAAPGAEQPDPDHPGTVEYNDGLKWMDDLDEAVEFALAEQRPIYLNFTGDT